MMLVNQTLLEAKKPAMKDPSASCEVSKYKNQLPQSR